MHKPFIHPDILLTVSRNGQTTTDEKLDAINFEKAKIRGKEFRKTILSELFNKVEYGNIESHFNTERLSSANFNNVREQIINLHYQRAIIVHEAVKHANAHHALEQQLARQQRSFFKFLFKKKIQTLAQQLDQSRADLSKLKDVEHESYLSITYSYETRELKEKYSDLISAFTTLKSARKIWDMTYSERNMETKAAAQTSMTRNEVRFTFNTLPVIRTAEKSFHFENFNGGDFFFYPSFVVYFKSSEDIALLDYSDLEVHYTESRFLEESKNIPADAQVIGETWYRVNKDGSPDKRFANNYKIPITLYGSIHLKTKSGVNELYYISDTQKARHFCEQYTLYQSMLKQ